MDAERWRRLEELYHAALDLERGRPGAFLEGACGSDAESLMVSGPAGGGCVAEPTEQGAAYLLIY